VYIGKLGIKVARAIQKWNIISSTRERERERERHRERRDAEKQRKREE